MKTKDRKIGEEFEIRLRLKVVEGKCSGCMFDEMYPDVCPYIDALGDCDERVRADKKHVCFEKVSYEVIENLQP